MPIVRPTLYMNYVAPFHKADTIFSSEEDKHGINFTFACLCLSPSAFARHFDSFKLMCVQGQPLLCKFIQTIKFQTESGLVSHTKTQLVDTSPQ